VWEKRIEEILGLIPVFFTHGLQKLSYNIGREMSYLQPICFQIAMTCLRHRIADTQCTNYDNKDMEPDEFACLKFQSKI